MKKVKLDKNNILDYFTSLLATSRPGLSHDAINCAGMSSRSQSRLYFTLPRIIGIEFSSDFPEVRQTEATPINCATRNYGIKDERRRRVHVASPIRLTSDGPHHLPSGPLILPPRVLGITIRLRIMRVKHSTGKTLGIGDEESTTRAMITIGRAFAIL